MKTFIIFVCAVALLASFGAAFAHLPEGALYYVYEWPDGKTPKLDGKLDEWETISDLYRIGLDQFFGWAGANLVPGATPDPANFNVRMWMSWNETENKMWVAAEVFDNTRNVDFSTPADIWQNDEWEIMIDADHSGGQYKGWTTDVYTEDQIKDLEGRQAQQFVPIPLPPPGMPAFWNFGSATFFNDLDPGHRKDLSDWGISYEGDPAGEGTSRYEVMLALFDEVDWRGPEVSKRHILKPDEVIGIQFSFGDFDESSTEYSGFWNLSQQDATFKFAERFTDAQMIKGITAVEANTWGRIKAGFAK